MMLTEQTQLDIAAAISRPISAVQAIATDATLLEELLASVRDLRLDHTDGDRRRGRPPGADLSCPRPSGLSRVDDGDSELAAERQQQINAVPRSRIAVVPPCAQLP